MTKQAAELYLLADGTYANPGDCEPDADGVLRHIYGMPVALREDGEPETAARGAVDNKNEEAAQRGLEAAASAAAEAEHATEIALDAEGAAAATDEEPAVGTSDPTNFNARADAVVEALTASDAGAKADAEGPAEKEIVAQPAKPYKNRQIKGK